MIWWDSEDAHNVNTMGLAKQNQRLLSKQELTACARAYVEVIREAGFKCGVYASTSWLNSELDMTKLADVPVWVAHYGVKVPTYKGEYDIWQYSSVANITGIPGRCDVNWVIRDAGAIPEYVPTPNPNPIQTPVKIGDKVIITGVRYATGETVPARIKARTHTVDKVGITKVRLKEIFSWVYKKDVKKV
jgi:hypothetical protein